jgi:hypothetical protein
VERIQDITEKDVSAEGWPKSYIAGGQKIKYVGPYCEAASYSIRENRVCPQDYCYSQECFSAYWNSLNAKRGYSWDSNPWVYVIEFERIKK